MIIPGDKSISHRAVIFGGIASGTTEIKNLLEAEDVLCTIEIMRDLGVEVKKVGEGRWRIEGRGLGGLRVPSKILYCGNSGTTLRLMTGLLAGLSFNTVLTGDASLNLRPMGRLLSPLRQMGAEIDEERSEKGRFIRITGRPLRGGSFKLPVASAQLKSALLLAGLSADGPVTVTEPIRSRDHSERMLKAFGADIQVRGRTVILKPDTKLKDKKLNAQRIVVPGDFSSAAFFIVAGLIHPDRRFRIVLKGIGINPTRTGALTILKKMGGKITLKNRRIVCGEPVADLVIRSSPFKGVRVSGKIIPSLIDEIPILAVAAAAARGKTVIRDAEELRIKETDRIRALATEIPKFGVSVKEFKDGLEITGCRDRSKLTGCIAQSYGDHRIAMSLSILGTIAQGKTLVQETDCIATSFPGFSKCLSLLPNTPSSKKKGKKLATCFTGNR